MSSTKTTEMTRAAKLKMQHDRVEEKLKQKRGISSLVQANANRPTSASRTHGEKPRLQIACNNDEQIPAVSLTCSNSSSVVSPESRTFTSFHNAPMAESDSDSEILQTAAVLPKLNDTNANANASITVIGCESKGQSESHEAFKCVRLNNVDRAQIDARSKSKTSSAANASTAVHQPQSVSATGGSIQDATTAWSDVSTEAKHSMVANNTDDNLLDSNDVRNSIDTAPKYPLFVMNSDEENVPVTLAAGQLWHQLDADKSSCSGDNTLKQDVNLTEDVINIIPGSSGDKQSKSTVDDSATPTSHHQYLGGIADDEASCSTKYNTVDCVSEGDSNGSFAKSSVPSSLTSNSYEEYKSKVNDLYSKHDMDISDFHDLQLPIPKHCVVKCRLERTRNRLLPHIHLYLDQPTNSRLLLSARRERTVANNYILSENALCSEENCIAKVKCNLWLNQYSVVMFDGVTPPPKPADVWTEKAAVVYKYRSRTSCPRKLKVILPTLNPSTSRPQTSQSQISLLQQSEQACNNVIVLHNKIPLWSNDDQAFTLLCRGRVKMASVKTFQLVTPDSGDIVMQFGRWDENAFTLDFTHPLSLIQAFGIALSAFEGKPFV